LIAVLVGLGWLDHRATVPGVWLAPALVAFMVAATHELLGLLAARGLKPIAPVVYLGNLLVLLSPWAPVACRMAGPCADADGWTTAAFVVAVVLAFVAEMTRYKEPGRVMADLAAAVFSVAYLGLLLSYVVRLRIAWGVGALASLLIVVKMGDTGAYVVGKALGRHPMSPVLSPNKTIEGAVGALVFSCLASWAVFRWLIPATTTGPVHAAGAIDPLGASIVFGLLIGGVGMLGDLAESLLKRDAACKDSSTWIPGLGGSLDMLDSIILASPVAYACWHLRLIG